MTSKRFRRVMRSFDTMPKSSNHCWRHVSSRLNDDHSKFVWLTSIILGKSTGPWEKDPHYFKDIQISALALLKMVMHARSGGSLEIMGLLLGKVVDNTMVKESPLPHCHSFNK